MLAALTDISHPLTPDIRNQYAWYRITVERLLDAMPFWNPRDLQRVSTNLREKGIIIVASAPLIQSDDLKFAFNEKVEAAASSTQEPARQTRSATTHQREVATPAKSLLANKPNYAPSVDTPLFLGKNFISNQWQPDSDTLAQLAQHNIPESFAQQQVPEFVTYWRERGEAHHSWGSKFINQTIRTANQAQELGSNGMAPALPREVACQDPLLAEFGHASLQESPSLSQSD